ncbi:aminotransferase-like domain-containing protein [Bacillus nitratireducens]|uniref:GntR family transcriptional regulator n=2 Tax=Bacillus nitratireducens TaxID=2026193 RepID=UPI0021B3EAE9|nr:GntR family transcriptional regulator [Bacillus nitratireducens]
MIADFNTSTLSQIALEIYIKSGIFHYHIDNVKKLYIYKMTILLNACSSYLPSYIKFTKPKGGLYLTIFLPSHINIDKLIHSLKEKHIYVDNASRMYLEGNKHKVIRISISQVNKDKIEYGINLNVKLKKTP